MNILVTGGTGFIGEHFIPLLLEKGHKVRLLVRNLEKAKDLFSDSCEYFTGDITDKNSLSGCCKNIDVVFHMVARVGNQLPCDENFAAFRSVNVDGSKNIVEESKQSGVRRFIFVSSIAAMGIVKENPITEICKCNPYLPYQVSKYEAEQMILNEFKINKFPGIIVRPTKVFGAGEHEFSYLTLAKLCKHGFFPKIGKGKNYTSNIYITDLVKGLAQLVDYGVLGETYILTSNESIGLLDTAKIIARVLNKKIICIPVSTVLMIYLATFEEKLFTLLGKKPIVTRRNIEATVSDRIYEISKTKQELNFIPQTSMEKGIYETVRWYKEKGLI